jgi:hypothetical protein
MTDTPAESAEAPRTPSPIEELCNHVVQQWCDGVDLETAVRGAIEESVRAALAARDAEWREAWSRCGHFQVMTACEGDCPLRALLSEGKPEGHDGK